MAWVHCSITSWFIAALIGLLFFTCLFIPNAGAQDSAAVDAAAVDAVAADEAEAVEAAPDSDAELDEFDESFEDEFAIDEVPRIADPLKPFNRAMFWVNDKLYFYALKPVARGYSAVVPQSARSGVRKFFTNVGMPVRFVNSVFQGKFKKAKVSLVRFGINSTVGLAGFRDPAMNKWDIQPIKEDLGQTLGHYGLGPGIFITWPVLGP